MLLLSALLAACAGTDNDDPADDGIPPVATWELAWSDEFDGDTLDATKWEIQQGDGKPEGLGGLGWGNNELQYYSPDNITVANGNLVITSKTDSIIVGIDEPTFEFANIPPADPGDTAGTPRDFDYSSGRIRTQGLYDFTYGRVEARIKMPATQGIWSAFWLLGTDPSPYGQWAAKGEIDIIETYARGYGPIAEPFASAAVHFGGNFPFNRFESRSTADFEARTNSGDFAGGFDFFSDYHIYAVEWDEEQIRWYIDGVNFYSVRTTNFYSLFTDVPNFDPPNTEATGNARSDTLKYSSPSADGLFGYQAVLSDGAPFDSKFHIILNSAVGGNLSNSVGEPPVLDGSGLPVPFSDEMLVDYVRVYKCNLEDAVEEGKGAARCKNTTAGVDQNGELLARPGFELPDDPRPADPENPTKILPNFSNEFLAATSTVYDLFFTGFFMYSNGEDADDIPQGPALSIQSTPAGGSWTTVQYDPAADPANAERYIRITPDPASNALQGIGFQADEPLIVSSNIGSIPGDIKFDLYVESQFNGQEVDDAYLAVNAFGQPRFLRVAIRSGEDSDNEGDFLFIPLSDLELDTWRRFTIPLQYLVSNGGNLGGGAADLSNVSSLLEFEISGVNFRLDNVIFVCGGEPCGVVGEVNVFTDAVDPIWDRGIVGDDTRERFKVPSNADYTDPNCCHVQWEEVELPAGELDFNGEPRGTVVETRFGTDGTDGAVNFIGTTTPFPSIASLSGQGEFQFDLRVTENPNDVELIFKIDADGSSTGEQPLGQLNLNEWKAFRCPISTLAQTGLDLSRITAPFVLVPGSQGAGQGVVVQWDNVRFTPNGDGLPAEELELPLDFEALSAFCLPITPFDGGSFSVVDNPSITAGNGDGENSNTRVAQTKKFGVGNDEITFGGIKINLAEPVTIGAPGSNTNKALALKTYSYRAGLPVSVKLEDGTFDRGSGNIVGRPGLTRVFNTGAAGQWETHVIDFNGEAPGDYSGLTIILDNGVVGDGTDNFRLEFDQIEQRDSSSIPASLSDAAPASNQISFEPSVGGQSVVYPYIDFGEVRSRLDANPDVQPGFNSATVMRTEHFDFTQQTRGTIIGGADGFENSIPFAAGRTTIAMDVYVPSGTQIEMKVEDAVDNNQFDRDIQVATSDGWHTLQFDFSDVMLTQSFEKLLLVFEPQEATPDPQVYYYDNIRLLPAP